MKEKDNEEVKAEADSSVESSEEKKEENGDVEKTDEAEEKPVENGSGKYFFFYCMFLFMVCEHYFEFD